ncbi:glycosyltransferase [Arthrobacter sp. NA-172]|uniref:glycosyltransferase n=1 Tax=Arthrobacter sp. NA-172 TaxID=3367524 RepID=UPI0037551FA4
MNTETVAITVTYGDRSDMCIETVRRALDSGAAKVIVVDNGSTDNSRAALEAFQIVADGALDIQKFEENAGTAIAFGAGILAALELKATHIWILDDDNWPEPGCLEACFDFMDALGSPPHSTALSCNRNTDEHHALLTSGEDYASVFEPDGVFFGFDLFSRLFGKKNGTRSATTSTVDRKLPQAPYGGLFAPSVVFQRVGLPRKDFVLYFDDVEYTRRMNDMGVSIFLCSDAKITDAGSKWVDSTKNRYLSGMIKAQNDVRTYYSYRNSIVLDIARARRNRVVPRFLSNFVIYSAYVVAMCLRHRSRSFLVVYFSACRDGVLRKMGNQLSLKGVG